MRTTLLVLAWLALATTVSAQYHDAVYLVGGLTDPYSQGGIRKVDLTGPAPAFTTLGIIAGAQYGFTMDANNRDVVSGWIGGLSRSGGLRRWDASTNKVSSFWVAPGLSGTFFTNLGDVEVDQDGNYVCVLQQKTRTSSGYSTLVRIARVDRSGVMTTLYNPNRPWYEIFPYGRLCRDIDTGHWLWATFNQKLFGVVKEIPVDSSPFADWAWNWGWGDKGMSQVHGTGHLVASYGRNVYQLKKRTLNRTTIGTLVPSRYKYYVFDNNALDLQTAASPRMLCVGDEYAVPIPKTGHAVFYAIDMKTYAVTSISMFRCEQVYRSLDFVFYRGRHLQTVLTAPNRWEIRLSCPRFAGKGYALVASTGGVRPGVLLPDGRRINLNPNFITYATLGGWLPGVWSAGPGVLDRHGEAQGLLDLTNIRPPGGFGLPLWIAAAVLDPQAPIGVAYLPDTYVIRL